MSASSAINRALIAHLGSDATLLASMVNGVYFDEAAPELTKFVIVSLVSAFDEDVFGARAYEDCLYLVEARGLDAPTDVTAAADRIDVLLNNATLSAAGYRTMTVHREERIEHVETDDFNPDLRWYRKGGHYKVQMCLV